MLVRRDIAPIACYGALFASVVLWAALRPINPSFLDNDASRSSLVVGHHDVANDQPEMRRFVKHSRTF